MNSTEICPDSNCLFCTPPTNNVSSHSSTLQPAAPCCTGFAPVFTKIIKICWSSPFVFTSGGFAYVCICTLLQKNRAQKLYPRGINMLPVTVKALPGLCASPAETLRTDSTCSLCPCVPTPLAWSHTTQA